MNGLLAVLLWPFCCLIPGINFRRSLYVIRRLLGSYLLIGLICLLLLAAVLSAYHLYANQSPFHAEETNTLIAALIGAAVTLTLLLAAVAQVQRISKSASADLIFRLTTRFFEGETRILVSLIDGDYLTFEERDPIWESYFLVNEQKVSASQVHVDLKTQLLRRKAYSTYEIDDFLGHFEDLADLERARTLDLHLIWSAFSFYMNSAWENEAI